MGVSSFNYRHTIDDVLLLHTHTRPSQESIMTFHSFEGFLPHIEMQLGKRIDLERSSSSSRRTVSCQDERLGFSFYSKWKMPRMFSLLLTTRRFLTLDDKTYSRDHQQCDVFNLGGKENITHLLYRNVDIYMIFVINIDISFSIGRFCSLLGTYFSNRIVSIVAILYSYIVSNGNGFHPL